MNARGKKPAKRSAKSPVRRIRKAVPYLTASAVAEPAGGKDIVLYQSTDGGIRVEVRIDADTVWLSLNQMAELFGRDKSVISRHLKNVFVSKELDRDSVVAKNATTAADGKSYDVEYFNLDAILSVGYRVNSKQGTQFRIWATQTLREHLIRGYTLNEKRLAQRGLAEAQQAIELLSKTLSNQSLVTDQGRAVLDVVQQYSRAWRLLLEYDEDRLPAAPSSPVQPSAALTLANARFATPS